MENGEELGNGEEDRWMGRQVRRDITRVRMSMEQEQLNMQRTVAERVVLRWENYEKVRYLHGHWSWNGRKLSDTGQFCGELYV